MLDERMRCDGKPFKVYGENLIELHAINQFLESLQAHFALEGALMADGHPGYAMPIGGVIMTDKNFVVPAWVGYDMGCGVCYIKTTFKASECLDLKKEIYHAIKQEIPVGFKHHDKAITSMPTGRCVSRFLAEKYKERDADRQLGTMGGNNHFIEVGLNDACEVGIVIHSGSRGIGHDVALHYMKIAGGGKAREGAYPLMTNQRDGRDYLKDLRFMLDFALLNRGIMLIGVEKAVRSLGIQGGLCWESLINKTHNHMEATVDGNIHRKGATSSGLNELGVIPGNPATGSYIVRGRGDSESLCSSSHGAGRTGSRKRAKATLSLVDFENDMDGIVADVSRNRLDESPAAYKDPTSVMDAQENLVEVIDSVEPFINVKG